MWTYNVKVNAVFVHFAAQYAYVDVGTLGWHRIKDGAADGVTNLLNLFNAAKANDRFVHVFIDTSDSTIRTAYLV